MLHSLNAQDYVLNLNSETIYELITQLKDNENKEYIAVARPADIDPLYIILKDIKEKAIKKREPKFLLKIKTRLLCDQKKPQTSRCTSCEAVLTSKYVAFEN